MTRDMDLVRQILLWAEAQSTARLNRNPEIAGYSEPQIDYHVHLLWQAGLVEALDISSSSRPGPAALITSITWAGHEFLAAAKNETVWNKAKSKVLTGGVSFTLEILKEFLVQAAKDQIGLP
jgi:hypothetical protein